MNKNKLILISIGAFLFLIMVLLSVPLIMRKAPTFEPAQVTLCDQLKHGVTVSELYKLFGNPAVEETIKGETWVAFMKNPGAKDAVRAKINKEEDKVLLLQCLKNNGSDADTTAK